LETNLKECHMVNFSSSLTIAMRYDSKILIIIPKKIVNQVTLYLNTFTSAIKSNSK